MRFARFFEFFDDVYDWLFEGSSTYNPTLVEVTAYVISTVSADCGAGSGVEATSIAIVDAITWPPIGVANTVQATPAVIDTVLEVVYVEA